MPLAKELDAGVHTSHATVSQNSRSIFKRNRMNLTWIESFPKRNTNKEYLFFIEFEGHPNDTRARRALDSLKRKVVHLEVLGAYARTTPIG